MSGASVTVGYVGVNQAYQLALAAQELGQLDVFYCSLYDAPGKWGGLASKLAGGAALINRRCVGFKPEAAFEIPVPYILDQFANKLGIVQGRSWFHAAHAFDHQVARRLRTSRSRLFVGVENCASQSFRVGRERGMKLVYDCPGFNPEVSDCAALGAAAEWSLPRPEPSDADWVRANKDQELALADCVLVYSEVHQRSWQKRGVEMEKCANIPLWIEPSLWFPPPQPGCSRGPLRVLYAGRGTLLKGLPYLLDAVRKCGRGIQLDCVGTIQKELVPLLGGLPNVTVAPPQPRAQLRDVYWNHDVLVLPSLGDSFGFVALEAMACGLPVIVTEHCGVPVPNPAWRVPVMNSGEIARRLEYYADDRDALARDGNTAQVFARQFTPERYREQIKALLQKLLA